MSDEYHSKPEGEEDASGYIVQPRPREMRTTRTLRRETTGVSRGQTFVARRSTLRRSTARASTSSTGGEEVDEEVDDEPIWQGPMHFDGQDLHYDLEHHVVSRFRAGVADSDDFFQVYGGSAFTTLLDSLHPDTLTVVHFSTLFPVVLTMREVMRPNMSREFLIVFYSGGGTLPTPFIFLGAR